MDKTENTCIEHTIVNNSNEVVTVSPSFITLQNMQMYNESQGDKLFNHEYELQDDSYRNDTPDVATDSGQASTSNCRENEVVPLQYTAELMTYGNTLQNDEPGLIQDDIMVLHSVIFPFLFAYIIKFISNNLDCHGISQIPNTSDCMQDFSSRFEGFKRCELPVHTMTRVLISKFCQCKLKSEEDDDAVDDICGIISDGLLAICSAFWCFDKNLTLRTDS
ncbi:hypothetical protein FQR65_LT12621 [Abscondita terminalis]|nr:hypothetical protein FQR65_LT12621 [Abscondita terminalis]